MIEPFTFCSRIRRSGSGGSTPRGGLDLDLIHMLSSQDPGRRDSSYQGHVRSQGKPQKHVLNSVYFTSTHSPLAKESHMATPRTVGGKSRSLMEGAEER